MELIIEHAASKKFLACVEMLLLAPKPLLSQPTYQLVSEVLAALTWQYGMLKGCEGLGELWRKVKLPQEPEIVRIVTTELTSGVSSISTDI